ncbi:F0F1 ATP synthase subunit A [Candidatus Mycoplasma haematominutum]|uniref:F0F1 ATP synthase subunit A n=1 Tax=Candidatus Mycoplasma haematominutum TaxID=209446 RepID=UPI0002D845F7|nr:F0F1 ATP synthase subunit A [Candidatus Mycoplasma haematominutum]
MAALLPFFNSQDNNTTQEFIGGALAVTILILLLGLYYRCSIEKAQTYQRLPKFTFLVFLFIRWVKKSSLQMLGERYKFAIPFLIYIVFYFWGTSLVSMFGFRGIGAVALVPLSISAVVFAGTVGIGISAKGWGFCREYFVWMKCKGKKVVPIPDVLKLLGELGKVVSLGLRLWGNYFAGALVLFLVSTFLESVKTSAGLAGSASISSIASFPLHFYFDVVDGALHSMIFLLLTLSYWMMAKHVEHGK